MTTIITKQDTYSFFCITSPLFPELFYVRGKVAAVFTGWMTSFINQPTVSKHKLSQHADKETTTIPRQTWWT